MKKIIKDEHTKELTKAITVSGLIISFFVIVLLNIDSVKVIISELFSTLSPFVWGILFAIIVFKPTQLIEKVLPNKISFKTRRLISSLISTLLIIVIIAIVVIVLLPQLIDSVASISVLISDYATDSNKLVDSLQKTFGLSDEFATSIHTYLNNMIMKFWKFLQEYIPSILSATINTFTSLVDFIIGFIICLYILIDRRKIAIAFKKLSMALLSKEQYEKGKNIMYLAVDKFTNFFSGKILDSLIIGVICFIAMLFIDNNYAVIIAVVVGITNIVPFFGPFIGAIPCSIILLLVDPLECLFFVIMIVILQQIDGNIIGPKILGDSVGLSSLWIIFAILIGGSLFGFFGMLLSVPVCAVIYYIVKEYVDNKLEEKKKNS